MKKFYIDDEEDFVETTNETVEPQFGCGFCWNAKRKQNKELFFLDAANNMRVCVYCPNCGRILEEE